MNVVEKFSDRYGPHAFGLISVLLIWFIIVQPQLERQSLMIEQYRQDMQARTDQMRLDFAAQHQLVNQMRAAAEVMDRASKRMERLTDETTNITMSSAIACWPVFHLDNHQLAGDGERVVDWNQLRDAEVYYGSAFLDGLSGHFTAEVASDNGADSDVLDRIVGDNTFLRTDVWSGGQRELDGDSVAGDAERRDNPGVSGVVSGGYGNWPAASGVHVWPDPGWHVCVIFASVAIAYIALVVSLEHGNRNFDRV